MPLVAVGMAPVVTGSASPFVARRSRHAEPACDSNVAGEVASRLSRRLGEGSRQQDAQLSRRIGTGCNDVGVCPLVTREQT